MPPRPAPSPWPRRIGGLGLLAATAAAAFTLLRTPTRAQVPTEASILSQHCQTFSKFKTWLSYPNTLIGGTYHFVLHVQDDGRFGMDSVRGQKERYYWDGSTLTKSNDSNPPPRVIDGYDQIITDLWSECRSGFANSTWATGVHPPPDAGMAA